MSIAWELHYACKFDEKVDCKLDPMDPIHMWELRVVYTCMYVRIYMYVHAN